MVVECVDKPMTVTAAADFLGVKAYDCALPHQWACQMKGAAGINPSGHFVWTYADPKTVFGRPRPITVEGHRALEVYDASFGTEYLRPDEPVIQF